MSGGDHLYEYNAPGEQSYYDPYGRCIVVNENYLNENPITINENSDEVRQQIIYADNVRNILVPKNLKKYESEIKKRFLEEFYFQKVEVENIYNEKEGKKKNESLINELKVNIIYIDEGQKYFPYADIEMENNYCIVNPIVVMETGNIDYSYYMSYLTRCVFFHFEGMDAFASLFPLIERTGTVSEIQSVESIYDNHAREIRNIEIRRNYLMTAMTVVVGLVLVISFVIVSAYYQEKKYKIYVKKLFGYNIIQRTYKFFILIFLIDIGVLCGVFQFKEESSILMLGIGIICFDLLMIILEGVTLDKKSFNNIIKGEH